MAIQFSDSRCSVGEGWSNITATVPGYFEGYVLCKRGIVAIYFSQKYSCATLRFVCNGNLYHRTIHGVKSLRHVVTLAKRFAAEKYAEGVR